VKCIFYALNLLIAIFLALFSNCSSSKLIEKGDKYYEKKDMRKAIKFYDKALKKEPGNYYAHCSLGFSYYIPGGKWFAKSEDNLTL